MEIVHVTKFVIYVFYVVVWQAFSGNKRLRGINRFWILGLHWHVGTYEWIWKASISLAFSVSFHAMGTRIGTSKDKVLSWGGALHKVEGVLAEEWGCRARGSWLMQVEFGDQRFTNGHCLSFLHFFVHVRVVVMKAGGECELSLERKVCSFVTT